MRQMIDSWNAVHVTGCNRVEHRQPGGAPFFQKMISDGAQSGVWTPEAARGTDSYHRFVRDECADFFYGDDLGARHKGKTIWSRIQRRTTPGQSIEVEESPSGSGNHAGQFF